MSQRFSDAELAAEYWRAKARASSIEANGYSPHYHLADAETFHRFATLPHVHEPNLVNETTKETPIIIQEGK